MRLEATCLALVALAACGTSEVEVRAVDELGATDDALSGNVAIGSTLETTADLNLRAGPSTATAVLRVLPLGARVTTIERSTPSDGFYRVSYQGQAGWSYGGYLKLVSSPQPATGCGEFSGYTVFNCSADGRSRLKCSGGKLVTETCAQGCSVMPPGVDDVCASTSATAAIDTVAEANAFFVNQWGPTAFTSGGAPYGYSDCVPTSGLMVLGALGLRAHPSPSEALGAIDRVRDLALGYNTTYSTPMDVSQLDGAFRAYGARAGVYRGASVSAIDGIISRGHFAVAAGGPWAAWGADLNARGQYLNFRDPGPHAVAVLGKTASGAYLVNDPLSKVGAITVSAGQLASFLSRDLPGIFEYSR